MKSNVITWAVLTAFIATATAPVLSPTVENFLIDPSSGLYAIQAPVIGKDITAWFYSYYLALFQGTHSISAFLGVVVVCAVIAALFVFNHETEKTDTVAKDSVLGNSKLIDSSKIRIKKNDIWDGKGKPKSAGLVYGFENGHYYYDSKPPHQITISFSGGGKTRYSMIPTTHLGLEAGCNLIISDLKNELIELTGEKAAEMSAVVLFDLEEPLKGNRYNPLDLVVKYAEVGDIGKMRDTADKLAANLVPTEDKNPFFSNAARGLLSACFVAVALADIERSKKNMASVCAMIDEGTTGESKDPSAALKDFFRSLGTDHPAFSSASEFLSDGGTTAGKNVLSTVKVALRPFTSPGIRWMTAKSDPIIDDLINKRTTLYIHVLNKEHPANCLLGCFFSQWWQRVLEIGNERGGSIPHKTNIVMDEFGSFPKIPLASIVNLGRGYGVSWYGYLQSITQLALYNRPGDGGAGAKEILSNIPVKVALTISEKEDREYFTELAGKRGVMARGESSQKSGNKTSSSTSSSERVDDLIHTWEWQNFSPDDDGAIVIKSKITGVKNRNGVFRMPLADATKTPAKDYFGLGSKEHETKKRLTYQQKLKDKAAKENINDVDVWHIDFDSIMGTERKQEAIESDEFSAWDLER